MTGGMFLQAALEELCHELDWLKTKPKLSQLPMLNSLFLTAKSRQKIRFCCCFYCCCWCCCWCCRSLILQIQSSSSLCGFLKAMCFTPSGKKMMELFLQKLKLYVSWPTDLKVEPAPKKGTPLNSEYMDDRFRLGTILIAETLFSFRKNINAHVGQLEIIKVKTCCEN